MKKLLLSAAFVLSAASAFAAVTANDLVASYQADGFNAIEVTTGITQIKVEAVKNGTKVEVVYDIASGSILKQEQKPARARDLNDTSVEVQTSATDFTDGSDDDSDDDHGRGRGSDDGADHDVGDDHGGDRDDDDSSGHGSDDDHDDDRGGSDHSGHGGGDDHDDDSDND
ncbi:PepSY domain-containing protein [Stagnihabitans tardus]|uniref:PepSY domain-containing protein n=1 Tax=Stagnihabitans tardus TaxID=2699202 RepID=A0AAE4YEI9_9RHOB|nr:PepSY domain-containing protein [Stagnihabitans tardus]NBZ88245.1 PepSY domain-containing protein [Stagnihabitans tardus]